jgi:uncharacterized membrane protein
MENTLNGATGVLSEQSAVQNAKSTASALKLVLVWIAVGIPMLWGMMKALEDVASLIALFP